jgi:hypothetical protein
MIGHVQPLPATRIPMRGRAIQRWQNGNDIQDRSYPRNGEAMTYTPGPGLIGKVRNGMDVVDSAQEKIGTVTVVKMSDPDAVTTQGQESGTDSGVLGTAPSVVPAAPAGGIGAGGAPVAAPIGILAGGMTGGTEPDVPEPMAERLVRTGFLKIDNKGLFKRDLYVAADQIAGVKDDTVMLATTKDNLIKES